jgi:LPXTG-motif cell wall-anchored protein
MNCSLIGEGRKGGQTMFKRAALVLCAVLLVGTVTAKADEWDKKTVVTFSEAVQLPGMVLQPGTYMFKLLNSSSDRNIVMVYNEGGTHYYGMILAIPSYKLNVSDKPVITFAERPKNEPPAIKAWHYPARNYGWEFVYPKAKAVELAKVEQAPVPAAEIKPAEPAEELAKEPVVAVTPEAKEVEIAKAEPVPQEVAEAAPAPQEPAAAPVEELPKTGSELPLVFLVGVLALGTGAAVRFARKAA